MAHNFSYTHYDLDMQRSGTVIEITLSAIANVRLMTHANFDLFKNARQHKFLGGVAKQSPIRLQIPQSGHWHVVVDMEGHAGKAESSIKMVPQAPQKPAPRFGAARPQPRSRRSFAHHSSRLRSSRSKPRSGGS